MRKWQCCRQEGDTNQLQRLLFSINLPSGPPTLCLLASTFLLFFLQQVTGIAHDSLLCTTTDETGQQQQLTSPACEQPSHHILKLVKRDDALAKQIAQENGMEIKGQPFFDTHYFLAHKENNIDHIRRKRSIEAILSRPEVLELIVDRPRRRVKREQPFIGPEEQPNFEGRPVPRLPFPDPLYQYQWYLVRMNVREAWRMGYAGRNVSITILDDGIQRDHPDLVKNYDPFASTDLIDGDSDPTPLGDNKHGTRCAGEVAATAGNDVCGVGVSFSYAIEAVALNFNNTYIDIYSASWGPDDDGETFDGPDDLAKEAIYRGIKHGRGGRGNIFVWASGNGGVRHDSCSADGYSASIYTLSFSSATIDNRKPEYLEECPSTIATTYSSSGYYDQQSIVRSFCT